jgi:glycosyltransferase involved in cell wall biosynthesis
VNGIIISDISVGYGTPQILSFAESIVENYNIQMTILEPDEKEKKMLVHDNINIIRKTTTGHPHEDYKSRLEYIRFCQEYINKNNFEIIVIPNFYSLPVLYNINSDSFVIYYALEALMPFGYEKDELEIHKNLASKINLLISTEENRLEKYLTELSLYDTPSLMLYNTKKIENLVRKVNRKNIILYQGSISKKNTFGKYYENIKDINIDLYGKCDEYMLSKLGKIDNSIKYKGFISSTELDKVRGNYSFSLIIWNPNIENQYYACPNKFFESIASGVPVISAPHPQMVKLIKRYKCGILMNDWSFKSFKKSLKFAKSIMGTEKHDEMIRNCYIAYETELNWNTQFSKVKYYLDKKLLKGENSE